LSGHGTKLDRPGDTHKLGTTAGLLRTQKTTDRARSTHFLGNTEGGTCQDSERKEPSKGHSQTRDHRGRDLSGHGKKPTNRGAPMSWRPQREGLVQKEAD